MTPRPMRRGPAWMFAVLAAAMLLCGCGVLPTQLPTYRMRVTINVDTPTGLRSGSSVYEVRTSRNGPFFPASPNLIGYEVRGEAVAVDLPGGTLYGVTNTGWLGSLMLNIARYDKTYQEPPHGIMRAREIRALIADKRVHTTPRYFYRDPPHAGVPKLVRFTDEHIPASVVAVDPDHLDLSFGPGVRLRSVTVQITRDKVTTGITRRLPWLADYAARGARLNGNTSSAVYDNTPGENLGSGAFSSELAQ